MQSKRREISISLALYYCNLYLNYLPAAIRLARHSWGVRYIRALSLYFSGVTFAGVRRYLFARTSSNSRLIVSDGGAVSRDTTIMQRLENMKAGSNS